MAVEVPVSLDPQYRERLVARVQAEAKRAREIGAREASRLLEGLLAECRAAGSIDPSLPCGIVERALARVREELELVEKLPSRVEQLLSEDRVGDAVEEFYRLLDLCSTGRFGGVESCGRGALGRLGVAVAGKIAEEVSGLYESSEFEEALRVAELASRLCGLDLPGIGKPCGDIARVSARIRDALEFLRSGVRLVLPEKSPSQRIRGMLRVEYKGNSILEGVRIDFTPASQYAEVEPSPVLNLPKLYPGVMFDTDVVIKSHFRGRITIPYRKCFKEYCIDEITSVAVGTLQAGLVAVSFNPGEYLGKPVARLRDYGPVPARPVKMEVEIQIGRYACTGILGIGGFAVALYCENTRTGERAVAKIPREAYEYYLARGRRREVKTMAEEEAVDIEEILGLAMSPRDVEEAIKVFDREARILQTLDHPNIIKVLDTGVKPFPYIVFPYCGYGDLYHNLVARLAKPLDVETVLQLMIPIGDALSHGHRRSRPVYHLDVKPHNILLDERLIPLLSDYNIARLMRSVSKSSRSKGFTPGFAAPEQINSNLGKIDHRADIFSHAATIYYLLTLNHPYHLDEWSPERGGFRNVLAKPVPVRKYNPEVPKELEEVLEKALQVHPEDRYEKTEEYVVDLVQVHKSL